jgi:hypothetical protein
MAGRGRIKKSKDFKALGKADFGTKDAQRLRDPRLARRSVSFLHQAFRYRGKANNREALFAKAMAMIQAMLLIQQHWCRTYCNQTAR